MPADARCAAHVGWPLRPRPPGGGRMPADARCAALQGNNIFFHNKAGPTQPGAPAV